MKLRHTPSRDEQQAFLDYGDRIVDGDTPPPINDLESTFLRVQSAMRADQRVPGVMPDHLRMRAWEEIMQNAATIPSGRAAGRPGTRQQPRSFAPAPLPRMAWSGAANIALALLVVVAGFGAWRVFDSGIGGGGDAPDNARPTHFAAQPLSGTPVPGTGEQRIGDPGNTNAYPAMIDTSRTYVAKPLGGPQMTAGYGVVVEDSLVFSGRPADANPESTPVKLYRQDLATGELLWESDIVTYARFTSDGSSVFALTFPAWPPQSNESPLLTAIDLRDGTVSWKSPPLAEYADAPRPEAPIFPTEPIAINGYVYVALDNGTVLSFNGTTGELAWEYADSSEPTTDVPPVIMSLAGEDTHIFAVMPKRIIVKLDRLSGEPVDTFAFPDSIDHAFNIRLHLQGTRLVATADVPGENRGADGFIVTFDIETGEPIWSSDLDFIPSEIAVTQTMIGVPQVTMTQRPFLFRVLPGVDDYSYDTRTLLLDLETGETLVDIDNEGGPHGWTTLSASGEVVCISDSAIICVDRAGTTTDVEGFEPPEGHALLNPALYHDGRIVIIDVMLPLQIAEPAS